MSDSVILRELIARRAGGDESGLPADEIIGRSSEGEFWALEYDGLVERVGDLYRASPEAMELSKGPDRPLRQYAHILLELEDEETDDPDRVTATRDPFAALAQAVDNVSGASTVGVTIPPLKDPESVAEGWVDAIVEAHEIDDEEAEELIENAIAAVTALIQGPRRTL